MAENISENLVKLGFLTNKYISTIRRNGVYVIPQDNLKNDIHEKVSEKEGHPSKKMHRLFAEMLYKEIIENLRWEFATEKR